MNIITNLSVDAPGNEDTDVVGVEEDLFEFDGLFGAVVAGGRLFDVLQDHIDVVVKTAKSTGELLLALFVFASQRVSVSSGSRAGRRLFRTILR